MGVRKIVIAAPNVLVAYTKSTGHLALLKAASGHLLPHAKSSVRVSASVLDMTLCYPVLQVDTVYADGSQKDKNVFSPRIPSNVLK